MEEEATCMHNEGEGERMKRGRGEEAIFDQ